MTFDQKLEIFNKLLENQPHEFKLYLLSQYFEIGEKLSSLSTNQQIQSYFFHEKILYYTKIELVWDDFYLKIYGETPEFRNFCIGNKKFILDSLLSKNTEKILQELYNMYNQ